MNYEAIEHLKESDFKTVTGVQRETFDQMLTVIKKGLREFGRPPKLSRADQLLMTLMCWRKYRMEFHRRGLEHLASSEIFGYRFEWQEIFPLVRDRLSCVGSFVHLTLQQHARQSPACHSLPCFRQYFWHVPTRQIWGGGWHPVQSGDCFFRDCCHRCDHGCG